MAAPVSHSPLLPAPLTGPVFPGHSGDAVSGVSVVMIILIILMRHFMSRNGIEIEWSVTASSLWLP